MYFVDENEVVMIRTEAGDFTPESETGRKIQKAIFDKKVPKKEAILDPFKYSRKKCSFYPNCKKAEKCKFLHEIKNEKSEKVKKCYYLSSGKCPFRKCRFDHSQKPKVCKYFLEGRCAFSEKYCWNINKNNQF